MSGHGWVTPNADGSKARCGGPGLCSECSKEYAQKYGRPYGEDTGIELLALQNDMIKANSHLEAIENDNHYRGERIKDHEQLFSTIFRRVIALEAAVQELNPGLNLASPVGRGGNFDTVAGVHLDPPRSYGHSPGNAPGLREDAEKLREATAALRVTAPAASREDPQADWNAARPGAGVDSLIFGEGDRFIRLSFRPAEGPGWMITIERVDGRVNRAVAAEKLHWLADQIMPSPGAETADEGGRYAMKARIAELERQNSDLQAANTRFEQRARAAEARLKNAGIVEDR